MRTLKNEAHHLRIQLKLILIYDFDQVILSNLKLHLRSFNGCSIKEINRLRKEINRLLSKGMSNIYLKVTIDTLSKLRFSGFKKFVTRSVFRELQLTQISLNFKTFMLQLQNESSGSKAV